MAGGRTRAPDRSTWRPPARYERRRGPAGRAEAVEIARPAARPRARRRGARPRGRDRQAHARARRPLRRSVTAVEPLDGMRAVLERDRFPARGRSPAPPRRSRCADASRRRRVRRGGLPLVRPRRAVAEIARVLRPGGGVAVLYNRLDWQDAREPVARRGQPRSSTATGSRPTSRPVRPDALAGRAGRDRASARRRRRGHVQRLDAAGARGDVRAPSAGSPGSRPSAATPRSPRSAPCLRRRGVREVELRFRTEITTAARKGAGRTTDGGRLGSRSLPWSAGSAP